MKIILKRKKVARELKKAHKSGVVPKMRMHADESGLKRDTVQENLKDIFTKRRKPIK